MKPRIIAAAVISLAIFLATYSRNADWRGVEQQLARQACPLGAEKCLREAEDVCSSGAKADNPRECIANYLGAKVLDESRLPSQTTNLSEDIDGYGNHYLVLNGPIVPGDAKQLAVAILHANARSYRLDALRLNSPGGDVWETLAMAVMIRWVENMATVVAKDAKCESACFGLFAAGYRKYIDPASDPTQIGVHSVYELIEHQAGTPALFWKESADTTVWAVRRLKAIGVPDSIISKIVTTPPDRMTYLSIEDLQQMGVEVTGRPKPATNGDSGIDSIWLSPAMVSADITLDNGAIVPAGTIVVTIDDVPPFDAPDAKWGEICFTDEFARGDHPTDQTTRTCNISYRTPVGTVATARVHETSLILIQQGWLELCAAPKAANRRYSAAVGRPAATAATRVAAKSNAAASGAESDSARRA